MSVDVLKLCGFMSSGDWKNVIDCGETCEERKSAFAYLLSLNVGSNPEYWGRLADNPGKWRYAFLHHENGICDLWSETKQVEKLSSVIHWKRIEETFSNQDDAEEAEQDIDLTALLS